MDLYEVVVAPKALAQLESYIAYIRYTLLNEQAAAEVWRDALETSEQLAKAAGSLRECAYPALREKGYRLIHFSRHRYVMLYRVEGNTAHTLTRFITSYRTTKNCL